MAPFEGATFGGFAPGAALRLGAALAASEWDADELGANPHPNPHPQPSTLTLTLNPQPSPSPSPSGALLGDTVTSVTVFALICAIGGNMVYMYARLNVMQVRRSQK